MTMPMNLAVDLTERELTELCRRTNAADRAGAVSRAARELLRTCRLRELTAMVGKLDYDEHAWRELDAADLSQPPLQRCIVSVLKPAIGAQTRGPCIR